MAVVVAESITYCPGGFPVHKLETVTGKKRPYAKVEFPPLGGAAVEVSAAVSEQPWCDDPPDKLRPCKLYELYDASGKIIEEQGNELQLGGVCPVCQRAATIFIRPVVSTDFAI